MVSASQASYRYHRYQSRSFIGCFPTKEDRDKTKTVKEVVTTGIDGGGAQDSLFVPWCFPFRKQDFFLHAKMSQLPGVA